ncbi:AraC family transcriptional regulator [Flindersiella endophytica]
MDVLSDAITAMRAGRAHSTLTRHSAPWDSRFPDGDSAGFHIVVEGSARFLPPAAEPVELSAGDIVFMTRERGHGLSGEGRAVLVCGAYLLDRTRPHPLLAGLPDVIHLPASERSDPSLHAAVELLWREHELPRPGGGAVLSALLDLLLVSIVRTWLEAHPTAGWAAALDDPAIAGALQAIHQNPARLWTVEALGAQGGLSRAAFSKRFTALVGQPPLTYVTWWRMVLAARLLRESDAPLAAVAQRAGYASEFAFARAFKREFGVAPGGYRKAVA